MPAPLSMDIRRRLQGLIEDGLSARAAARHLLISPATGVRLASKVRLGESLAASKCGRSEGHGKLSAHRAFLVELAEQDPDITLMELRGALAEAEGVEVHCSAICRMLRRLGFTDKKSRWPRPSA